MNFFGLSQPTRFLMLSKYLTPLLLCLFLGALTYGLYQSLYISPPDYQQGESVRLMYIHVPAAWMALFIYVSMGIASAVFLIFRHNLASLYCRSVAPLGMMFTVICLITGSIWGNLTWGAYWVWDARLTSVLILLFLYIGYWVLKDTHRHIEKGEKMASILVLIGLVNIPVIKFSVDWFQTLHQPASFKAFQRPSIHPDMLVPLLWMACAYFLLYGLLTLWRMQSLSWERKIKRLQMKQKGIS